MNRLALKILLIALASFAGLILQQQPLWLQIKVCLMCGSYLLIRCCFRCTYCSNSFLLCLKLQSLHIPVLEDHLQWAVSIKLNFNMSNFSIKQLIRFDSNCLWHVLSHPIKPKEFALYLIHRVWVEVLQTDLQEM